MTPQDQQDQNGWAEYQRLVLDKLRSHDTRLDHIYARLGNIDRDLAGLKVRAGVRGFLAGAVPSLGAIMTLVLMRLGR